MTLEPTRHLEFPSQPNIPDETWLSLACVLEATIPKPGNVHRGADFEDLSFPDFAVCAAVAAPYLAQARAQGVGQAVHQAVLRSREFVPTNVNLGIALLLAPLSAGYDPDNWQAGVRRTLGQLTPADAEWVYRAIQLAAPGGLGQVDAHDVMQDQPPAQLRDAMQAAADRDRVAYQYVHDFDDVFERIVPSLQRGQQQGWPPFISVIHTHLECMAQWPDSLIARKAGVEVARQSAAMAQRVLDSGPPESDAYRVALSDLDFWLRSDGNRRNPGTTADLIAAGLYVALRTGVLRPPYR